MQRFSTRLIVVLLCCILISCDRNETAQITRIPMDISEIQVYTAEILPEVFETPHFACIAIVGSEIHGGYKRFSDYKTEYPLQIPDNTFAQYPIYNNGDTLNVKMTEHRKTVGDGVGIKALASFHREVVFLGFCTPGDYTLNINGVEKAFHVGKNTF